MPPPYDYRALIDVGVLPLGWHTFEVVAHYQGEEFAHYSTQPVWVAERDWPGQDLSGVWYPPSQNGRGLFVVRSNDAVALYWATHGADGTPSWVVTTIADPYAAGNHLSGPAVFTTGPGLSPAPAELEQHAWGTLTFDYHGCGRATLGWDAIDPAVIDGSIDMVQLMVPDGVESCDIGGRVQGLPAIRVDD